MHNYVGNVHELRGGARVCTWAAAQNGLAFCFMVGHSNVPTKSRFEACYNWTCVVQNVCLTGKELKVKGDDAESIAIVFLLTVNDTWYPNEYPGKTCLHTVKTPPIKPDIPWNESVNIAVGECDHGPLTYTIYKQLDGTHIILYDFYDQPKLPSPGDEEHTYIEVTFFSSVIEDASHPSCHILWDYKYTEPVLSSSCKPAFLPGCFNAESREGYHMTYYWFNILDWQLNWAMRI